MLKNRYLLPLIALSAISISSAAAFFSVYGLSKVFAGASLAVIIMASVLEFSKIITAFSLHQTRDRIPSSLKAYLTAAVLILMVITSAGIYGFLSNAYQLTANKDKIVSSEISIIEAKVQTTVSRLEDFKTERSSLINEISELRKGLSSGTTVEYIDKNTGQKVSTSSAAIRKSLESQLDDAILRRNDIDKQIENLSAQADSFKISILEKQVNNTAATELGPLVYLAKVTGMEMDKVVNYFILLIVIVFDPLAICLVIAISFLIKKPSEESPGEVNQNEEEEVKEMDIFLPEKNKEDNLPSKKNLPRFRIATEKKLVPTKKIVDNGQTVRSVKEEQKNVIEIIREEGVDQNMSVEDYRKLFQEYLDSLENTK